MVQVNYKVRQSGWRRTIKLYHINLLKRWYETDRTPIQALSTYLSHQVTPDVPMGKQLTPHQIQDLRELMDRNRDVFFELPGRTSITAYDIVTKPGKKIRL